jgi:hypothetical protein
MKVQEFSVLIKYDHLDETVCTLIDSRTTRALISEKLVPPLCDPNQSSK